MLSSSLFHLFSCHSASAHFRFRALDHVGIVTALFGTLIAFIVEIFHCHPVRRRDDWEKKRKKKTLIFGKNV